MKAKKLFNVVVSDSLGEAIVSKHGTQELANSALAKSIKANRKRTVAFSIRYGEFVSLVVNLK